MAPAIKWTEKVPARVLSLYWETARRLEELRAWAESWEGGRPITGAAILYGPAGTGKTSAGIALRSRKRLGLHRDEWPATPGRGYDPEDRRAGLRSTTFSGRPRLVILDEADNLHGTADRGGAAAMLRLVRETGASRFS